MLTRLLVIGAILIAGVAIYLIVNALMNRRPRATSAGTPVDIVDRDGGRPNPPTSAPKYESPDERIARIEEELRRLDDDDNFPPKDGA